MTMWTMSDIKAPDWINHIISSPAEIAYLEMLDREGLVLCSLQTDEQTHLWEEFRKSVSQCPDCGKVIHGRPVLVYVWVDLLGRLHADTRYLKITSRYCECIPF